MPHKKIILRIHPDTGELDLSDGGTTIVRTGWFERNVKWVIDDPLEIKSFLIKGKTVYNPFEELIPTDFNSEVKLKVKKPQPPLDWEYSIHWKDENQVVHIYDPKISIDPSYTVPIAYLLLGIGTFILSVVSISWLLSKKKSRR